jgi:hypothetical protein
LLLLLTFDAAPELSCTGLSVRLRGEDRHKNKVRTGERSNPVEAVVVPAGVGDPYAVVQNGSGSGMRNP